MRSLSDKYGNPSNFIIKFRLHLFLPLQNTLHGLLCNYFIFFSTTQCTFGSPRQLNTRLSSSDVQVCYHGKESIHSLEWSKWPYSEWDGIDHHVLRLQTHPIRFIHLPPWYEPQESTRDKQKTRESVSRGIVTMKDTKGLKEAETEQSGGISITKI